MLHGPAHLDVVRTAVRLARSRDARLHILVQHTPPGRNAAPEQPDDRTAPRDVAAGATRLGPAVPVDTGVATGHANELIAGLTDSDLLIVAAQPGRLDSLARAALYHARMPVLLAREPNACPG